MAKSSAELIQQFNQNFEKIINVNQQDRIKTLPWYLMIGNGDSGKTTLLANSGLPFKFAKRFKSSSYQDLPRTQQVNWWVAEQGVILEVPSIFTQDADYREVWLHIIRMAQKNCQGLIIQCDLCELLNQSNEEAKQNIRQLRAQLYDITKKNNSSLPVYFIVNKWDQLAGFSEFFGDLGLEERQQVWGMTFPYKQVPAQFLDKLHNQYDELLARINKRLIWRLHQERDINKREHIQDFPLQVESIKNIICHFIEKTIKNSEEHHKAQLRGIYFTSAIQKGDLVDRLLQPIARAFELQTQVLKTHQKQTTAYFARGIFENRIFVDGSERVLLNQNKKNNKTGLRVVAYGASAGIIMTCAVGWAHNFNHHVKKINTAQQAVTEFNLLKNSLAEPGTDFSTYLPLLDALKTTANKKNSILDSFSLPLGNTKKLEDINNIAKIKYQQALKLIFIDKLSALLEKRLDQANASQPGKMIDDLKVYLMLGEPQYFSKKTVEQWLAHYLSQQKLNPKTVQQLLGYFNVAYKTHLAPINLNHGLVNHTRAILNSYPQALLALMILKEQWDMQYGGDFYTAKALKHLYPNDFDTIAKELLSGNWVLDNTKQDSKPGELTQLIKNTETLYAANYINTWHKALKPITPVYALPQLINEITKLTQAHSPMVSIVNDLIINTTKNNLPKGYMQNISKAFVNQNKVDLKTILIQLDLLNNQLKQVQSSKNPNDIALALLEATEIAPNQSPLYKLNLLSNTTPAPIRLWLSQIVNSTNHLLMPLAKDSLNGIWNKKVYTSYQKNLENTYPLNRNSKQQASLASFSQFFAPNGLLESFTNQFLLPFINTHKTPWQWKAGVESTWHFSNKLLTALAQQTVIHHMYFNNKTNQPEVLFSLQPQALEPIVKSFSLSLNGQNINYYKDTAKKTNLLKWPGQGPYQLSINFHDINGKNIQENFYGPWALFQLLDQSDLSRTMDSQHFNLTMDIHGSAARYLLTASQPVNPFGNKVLQMFYLPKDLFSNATT